MKEVTRIMSGPNSLHKAVFSPQVRTLLNGSAFLFMRNPSWGLRSATVMSGGYVKNRTENTLWKAVGMALDERTDGFKISSSAGPR